MRRLHCGGSVHGTKETEMRILLGIVVFAGIAACASPWKVQGGPAQCEQMCTHWHLQFAAMVGVGNQDPNGPGATACVCVPAAAPPVAPPGAATPSTAGGATSATLAAPIAIAAAQAMENSSDSRSRGQPSSPASPMSTPGSSPGH